VARLSDGDEAGDRQEPAEFDAVVFAIVDDQHGGGACQAAGRNDRQIRSDFWL
jgi:hypothetical protein